MQVYVIEKHYDYEGSQLDEIWADKDQAIERAKQIAKDWRGLDHGCEMTLMADCIWGWEYGSASITVTWWDVKPVV